MLATQQSMGNSLRWMRRGIVIILITANLMAVFLADTAAATQNLQSFFPNVWNQHGVNLFVHYNSSLGIDDIAIGLTGVGTEANAPQFGLTTR